MTIKELKEASSNRQKVIYDGLEYTCIGVQVLYKPNERLVSACLEDKHNRLFWISPRKIKISENIT